MKVACLQLDPIIGDVHGNLNKADSILNSASLASPLDLLVLPELAFTGYTFAGVDAIRPYLEPTTSGASTKWAQETARRLQCHVIVGYPEISTELDDKGVPLKYNSTVTVDPKGEVVATYRKSFLYYTDECWAAEGSGFFCTEIGSLGMLSHGICMDINPYQFTAPWTDYEFTNHSINGGAKLIVLSTAWITNTSTQELSLWSDSPDTDTVTYWLARFNLLSNLPGQEFIVVFANRIGTEVNHNRTIHTHSGQTVELEEMSSFAGSSCVMRFSQGKVEILDILGQAVEGLLVVDTAQDAKGPVFALRPPREEAEADVEAS